MGITYLQCEICKEIGHEDYYLNCGKCSSIICDNCYEVEKKEHGEYYNEGWERDMLNKCEICIEREAEELKRERKIAEKKLKCVNCKSLKCCLKQSIN